MTPEIRNESGNAAPWVFSDLTDAELRSFFERDCECRTRVQSGMRHGYRCPAHRAQDELDRRHANGKGHRV